MLLLFKLLSQWFSYIGPHTTSLFTTQLTTTYSILGWSGLSGVLVVAVAFAINYPLARYDISVRAGVLHLILLILSEDYQENMESERLPHEYS